MAVQDTGTTPTAPSPRNPTVPSKGPFPKPKPPTDVGTNPVPSSGSGATGSGSGTGSGSTPGAGAGSTPAPASSSPQPTAAAQVFINMFEALGMADLGKQIAQMFTDPNLTVNDIEYKIYDLPAYKALFPGMDVIRKSGGGLSGITTEAQYLQQRAAYQQVLKNNLLPQGFYDTPQDFANWMINGVSPNELNQRITQAKKVVDSADPSYAAQALDYYGLDKSHLMAYVLDPTRAQPLIDKQMKAIDMGAAAQRQGIGIGAGTAEGLVNDGFLSGGLDQMNNAWNQTADVLKTDSKLAALEGSQFTQGDAIDAVIKNSIAAQRRATELNQREVARFNGSSAGKAQFARTSGI